MTNSIEQELFEAAKKLIHLRYPTGWGGGISVAVSNTENKLIFKKLRELMPYHCSIVNGTEL